MNNNERSERWRRRRKEGLIALSIDISPQQRQALACMGLVPDGQEKDKAALVWAVERYLDTAVAVRSIGDALYKTAPPGRHESNGA